MQAQSIDRLPDLSLYANTQSRVTPFESAVPSLAYKRLIVGGIGILLFAASLGAWVSVIGFRLYALSHF